MELVARFYDPDTETLGHDDEGLCEEDSGESTQKGIETPSDSSQDPEPVVSGVGGLRGELKYIVDSSRSNSL